MYLACKVKYLHLVGGVSAGVFRCFQRSQSRSVPTIDSVEVALVRLAVSCCGTSGKLISDMVVPVAKHDAGSGWGRCHLCCSRTVMVILQYWTQASHASVWDLQKYDEQKQNISMHM